MSDYVGRFAPTPSGLLHFGSLVTAVASYLDARFHQGQWLVRIEDLDPPRVMRGASEHILNTLEQFGLEWDGSVVYQSQRTHLYQEALDQLIGLKLSYPCICSRKQIAARSQQPSSYDRYCIQHPPKLDKPVTWRLLSQPIEQRVADRIQTLPLCTADHLQDCVIKRRDQLFAYQLAVVVDDHWQQVTDVVRGSDLFTETAPQWLLQQQLNYRHPNYAHLPIAINPAGQKLSKQNLAPVLDATQPNRLIYAALRFLGQPLPEQEHLKDISPAQLLLWASKHWQIDAVPKQMQQHVSQ